MKFFLSTVTVLILFISGISAQEESFVPKKTIISFVPQYLIIDGIRIDVERQIKGKHYLQVCPQLYLNKEPKYYANYEKMIGGGLFIYHKYFPNENRLKNGIYMAYGLTYNYFQFDVLDDNDEITMLKVNKVGADLVVGYQYLLNNVISFDFYTGIGNRNSIFEGTRTDILYDATFGYGYTGNLFLFGFRIGFLF